MCITLAELLGEQASISLVSKLQLGNAVLKAPASNGHKSRQAGAWEAANWQREGTVSLHYVISALCYFLMSPYWNLFAGVWPEPLVTFIMATTVRVFLWECCDRKAA